VSAIKDPPVQTQTPEDAKEKYSPGPPSNATPQEKLLWTPTEGEDATKALFPLTRHVPQRSAVAAAPSCSSAGKHEPD
jgi:hypothetical protein